MTLELYGKILLHSRVWHRAALTVDWDAGRIRLRSGRVEDHATDSVHAHHRCTVLDVRIVRVGRAGDGQPVGGALNQYTSDYTQGVFEIV